jgi:hypothetical protein
LILIDDEDVAGEQLLHVDLREEEEVASLLLLFLFFNETLYGSGWVVLGIVLGSTWASYWAAAAWFRLVSLFSLILFSVL